MAVTLFVGLAFLHLPWLIQLEMPVCCLWQSGEIRWNRMVMNMAPACTSSCLCGLTPSQLQLFKHTYLYAIAGMASLLNGPLPDCLSLDGL